MRSLYYRKIRLLTTCATAAFVLAGVTQSIAAEGATPVILAQAATPAGPMDDRQILLQRLQQLEQRLNQIESRSGAPGAPPPPPATTASAGTLDTKAILDRLDQLDARLANIETNAVLSEPKTIVRQTEVYVDPNGVQYDQPAPERRAVTTYQRERVFRRQSIGEEIEDALASQEESGVTIGVSSITTAQAAFQTLGAKTKADQNVYGVSQADITFLAESAALNTSFFADVVAIGGPPPDGEIPALTLLNAQGARLSNNQLNLREAWVRTEIFNQQLALTVGQLDLTNYFDRNAVANDETSQFISDALVNNPVLGLSSNGLGASAIFDPKNGFNFKLGVQQSNTAATSLSDSLYTLGEVEYLARPFGLPEGHYRLWGRLDNSTGTDRTGFGVSIDQKLTPTVTLFSRYGNGYVGGAGANVYFFSAGLGFQAPFALNPLDSWGIGFANTRIAHGPHENLGELFYNLHLTDRLQLSFMMQYVVESSIRAGYLLPGMRLGVGF